MAVGSGAYETRPSLLPLVLLAEGLEDIPSVGYVPGAIIPTARDSLLIQVSSPVRPENTVPVLSLSARDTAATNTQHSTSMAASTRCKTTLLQIPQTPVVSAAEKVTNIGRVDYR